MLKCLQVKRSKSTGTADKNELLGFDKDYHSYREENANDPLGEKTVYSGDSDDTVSKEHENTDSFSLNVFENISDILQTNMSLSMKNAGNSSDSCLSLSESEPEEAFQPELFGLLDNPGVVRFGCLDYPLTVTEGSHQEYGTDMEHNFDHHWIRVSYDDLNMDVDAVKNRLENTFGDTKILSRSLDNIHNQLS